MGTFLGSRGFIGRVSGRTSGRARRQVEEAEGLWVAVDDEGEQQSRPVSYAVDRDRRYIHPQLMPILVWPRGCAVPGPLDGCLPGRACHVTRLYYCD